MPVPVNRNCGDREPQSLFLVHFNRHHSSCVFNHNTCCTCCASKLTGRCSTMLRGMSKPQPAPELPRVVRLAYEALQREERFPGERKTALDVLADWEAGRIQSDGDTTLEQRAKIVGLLQNSDQKPHRPKSQADKLVELTEHVEFFHADVDEPFATVRLGDHVETWAVHSKGFRRWLCREFYLEHKKAP